MHTNNSYPKIYILSLLATGLGIGWLVGLSTSPVVLIVITSLTGSAAAIVAAMSGLEKNPETAGNTSQNHNYQWKVNPIPIAMLVIGIVIGSAGGIYVRNQNLLGNSNSQLADEIKQWSDAGLDKTEVARRLFENRYSYRGWLGTDLSNEVDKWTKAGITDTAQVANRLFESTYPLNYELSTTPANLLSNSKSDSNSILYGSTQDACITLVGHAKTEQDDAKFRDIVAHSQVKQIKTLSGVITDTQTLREVVITLCEAQ